MFAALNIYKPKGLTSHDVVARLRRIYGLKKVGHLGTLDPLAEGVLPVCLGQATRLIEYFPTGKRYTAQVTLGRTTATLDSEGEILTEADCRGLDLTAEALENVLSRFRGLIQQQVPLYSAVHVDGKKLYKHARKQEATRKQEDKAENVQEIESIILPSREVTIHQLELLDVDLSDPAHPTLVLDIACSSGTYIRSLARDIGDALGRGAYLSGLLRTEHGLFRLKDSVRLETLQETDTPQAYLLNPVSYLAIPTLELPSEEAVRLLSNGMRIALPSVEAAVATALKPAEFYLAIFQNRPIGVVSVAEGLLKPLKIFPAE